MRVPCVRVFSTYSSPSIHHTLSHKFTMLEGLQISKQISPSDFTKCIDGSHLLWKLLLLLGLCVRCPCCPHCLLGLPSGLAAVRQPKCRVGSLHGAGVYGGWGIDGGSTGLAHTNWRHGVREACIGRAQHSCGARQIHQFTLIILLAACSDDHVADSGATPAWVQKQFENVEAVCQVQQI